MNKVFRITRVRPVAAALALAAALAPRAGEAAWRAALVQTPDAASVTRAACEQCHPASRWSGLRQSREEWQRVLEDMTFYGWNPTASERRIVLDHLSTAFGPDSAPGSAQGAASASLPSDVHPKTRNRLPPFKVEELDEFGKALVAKDGEAAIRESAPRSIRIYSPRVAEYMTKGNSYLRREAGIDPKVREVAILSAARAMSQPYEWAAHVADAREAGLPEAVIDVIRHGRPIPADMNEQYAAVIVLGREVYYDHKVKPATYARVERLFGKKKLVDIVSLMGHYTATAVLLTVFDQHVKEGEKEILPPLTGTPPTGGSK